MGRLNLVFSYLNYQIMSVFIPQIGGRVCVRLYKDVREYPFGCEHLVTLMTSYLP